MIETMSMQTPIKENRGTEEKEIKNLSGRVLKYIEAKIKNGQNISLEDLKNKFSVPGSQEETILNNGKFFNELRESASPISAEAIEQLRFEAVNDLLHIEGGAVAEQTLFKNFNFSVIDAINWRVKKLNEKLEDLKDRYKPRDFIEYLVEREKFEPRQLINSKYIKQGLFTNSDAQEYIEYIEEKTSIDKEGDKREKAAVDEETRKEETRQEEERQRELLQFIAEHQENLESFNLRYMNISEIKDNSKQKEQAEKLFKDIEAAYLAIKKFHDSRKEYPSTKKKRAVLINAHNQMLEMNNDLKKKYKI